MEKKRTLEDLQKQYSRSGGPGRKRGPMGHGPGGPGMRGAKGKPKNMGATVKRLLHYVGAYKFRFVIVLVCMLLNTAASLCGSYMLAPIINRLTLFVTGNQGTMSAMESFADGIIEKICGLPVISAAMASTAGAVTVYITSALALLAAVYVISIACTYLQARLMLSISQNSVERIRNDLFSKMQALPVRYFDRNSTGEVMSRYTNDIDNIDTMLNNSLVSLVSGAVTLIGTFVFMITTNIWLTLITVAFVPVFLFAGGFIAGKSSKYYSGQQAAIGAVNGYIEESVTGSKVVKVFNHEKVCEEEFELLNDDLREKQFKAQFYGGIMGPIMGNSSQVCYGVTIGVGGILMCLGRMTPGALTVFAGYSRQFSRPINEISMQMSTIFAALAGAERVFAVMDELPEVDEAEQKAKTLENVGGEVKFEHVTFGYVPEKTVLKDLSLYAKPGQKIAFVGSTGAGKTTITNLLTRFYDINEGQILIDGVDIREYNRLTIRKKISMVLQDTHLFTGTVRDNIRYGRLDATDEEVEAAAKLASAHSFIMRLSKGYDTVIEGDGANLSQGQRQLLNIARAAIANTPILVLDEATSSVDTRTERHIEHGLDRLMKGKTTFIIAHRLSTVRHADAIMVLEQGKIVERGTHEQLLEQKGRYYQLYTGAAELD